MNTATKFLLALMKVKITITFDGQVDMPLAEAMVDNIYSRMSFFAKRDPELVTTNKFVSLLLPPSLLSFDCE